ncbi:hypothetical protein [Pseudomonas auratipiscis]|uniref:DUF4145 domain-containing protein n=1 Tax=Pseudomonas auratipiscis TaxID=3115853 RepID=A0AB35WX56_9PSED|nr:MULTISPECIES: hypothetical protein [unclassified Pseudomonas]MEE1868213.1 hypothetical protein [Pseudomonas sp. 120P]MEE1957162.1 hypothetical protein [Pseudomonas sp. 119P]
MNMAQLTINNGTAKITVAALPDCCPVCRVGINSEYLQGRYCSTQYEVDALFACPKIDCNKFFIASYRLDAPKGIYYLKTLSPRSLGPVDVVKEVKDISPQFTEIFTQATQAEQYGLDEIAGVGYRKSLEYLIKDYCVAQHPDKEDDIKKRPIGQVIEGFVTNENVKQCAKRAVWLGNDETHYVRKWVDKDIKDLKLLIQITVNWIQQEVITKKLLEDMQ